MLSFEFNYKGLPRRAVSYVSGRAPPGGWELFRMRFLRSALEARINLSNDRDGSVDGVIYAAPRTLAGAFF